MARMREQEARYNAASYDADRLEKLVHEEENRPDLTSQQPYSCSRKQLSDW